MRKREFSADVPEFMDSPDAARAELEAALRSLRGLNRFFGSHRIVSRFMKRWIRRGDQLSVLDLATGSADIPRLLVAHARKVGATVKVRAIDFQPSTIETAQRLSAGFPEIVCECVDVLSFQPNETFEIVICSLALHHFSNEDAVRLLTRARELSRRYVLVSDLRRGFLLAYGVRLLTALIFRDRMTRHDGRLSAARAFSLTELRALAVRAGWTNFSAAKFPFAWQAIWLERS